jgi:hypothetical protein
MGSTRNVGQGQRFVMLLIHWRWQAMNKNSFFLFMANISEYM